MKNVGLGVFRAWPQEWNSCYNVINYLRDHQNCEFRYKWRKLKVLYLMKMVSPMRDQQYESIARGSYLPTTAGVTVANIGFFADLRFARPPPWIRRSDSMKSLLAEFCTKLNFVQDSWVIFGKICTTINLSIIWKY